MLGSTESSSTPKDFQPNPAKGLLLLPQIASHAWPAPPGKGYIAVGMTRGAGLLNRLAQQADKRVVDTRVADARRRQPKFMAHLCRAATSGHSPGCRSRSSGLAHPHMVTSAAKASRVQRSIDVVDATVGYQPSGASRRRHDPAISYALP